MINHHFLKIRLRSWAVGPSWEPILSVLRADEDGVPTLLDGTYLTKVGVICVLKWLHTTDYLFPHLAHFPRSHSQVTFIHSHVPTLAFLARMALTKHITNITLTGWSCPDLPRAWREFIGREREGSDSVIHWVE